MFWANFFALDLDPATLIFPPLPLSSSFGIGNTNWLSLVEPYYFIGEKVALQQYHHREN